MGSMKKPPRPKTRILRDDNGKAKSFKLRISPEELHALKSAAERTRMSAAQYLRQILRLAVGLPT